MCIAEVNMRPGPLYRGPLGSSDKIAYTTNFHRNMNGPTACTRVLASRLSRVFSSMTPLVGRGGDGRTTGSFVQWDQIQF